ncbi:hypothetical protein IV102_24705 [bacterium]|nr:hypothetical protein [bacterium]
MVYRDILSGKYYQLPGPCLVRAFRHGQCVELREHTPDGSSHSRRWLAHADGRIRLSRGVGQDFPLSDLQPCDPEHESRLLDQLEASRLQLEAAAMQGVGAFTASALKAYPGEAGRVEQWGEHAPQGPWSRSKLLDLLRLLQDLNEIAIHKHLPQIQRQIENAQEAGYDLWAMLALRGSPCLPETLTKGPRILYPPSNPIL